MRFKYLALALCLTASAAFGADDQQRALAAQLTDLMQIKKTIEDSFDMVRQMIPEQAKMSAQMAGHGSVPNNLSNVTDRIIEVMSQELSWDKIKEEYIALYAETFTAEELNGLIDFYKSPAGQAFVAKQPELMRRSVQINQRMMMNVMPKLQALMRESRLSTAPAAPSVKPPATTPAP